MIKEFRDFLAKYGIIGLAIAVIIGGKLNDLVTSLVNDLFMPIIFKPLLEAANIADIRALQWNGIFYGRVIGSTIDFLVVAIVIFCISKFLLTPKDAKKA